MKKVALAVWRALLHVQRGVLVASATLLILLLTSEVVMRYIIHYPGMEVEEIAGLLAFWLYFMGAAYGTYDRSHIKAEVTYLMFKDPRKLAIAKASAVAIALVLAGIMVSWGLTYFIWGITQGERSRILFMPMVLSQSSIFFGAILMFLYFTTELVDMVRQAMGRDPIVKKEG
jgi:TRAP-type C4-dicarboxylate transport system permease small subunit